MKRETLKRMTAVALAFAVAASSSGIPSVVQAQNLLVRTQSETQMSSDKEAVYVNTYSASARELDFDENWKFYLGDASGADSKTYDDSAWDNVTLPHDYSIDQEYTKAGEAESGYLLGGTGWYRKHFNLTSDMKGKEIRIDFDGVYMDSTVWVNGTQVGAHPYGYTPFSFDITDYVTFDQENVITVKVNHQTPSSRWYSGSGIYRDVTLTVMDKVHVDLYGTEITTPNLESEKDGTVNMTVKTTVANESSAAANVVLVHTIYEKGTNNSIGTVTTEEQSVNAGEAATISATLPAANPKLWSVKDPNLYTVTTQVKVGEAIVDTYDTEFGFRYFKFDSNTGFSLNGEKMKLKGVCMHHDQGALGAEAYYASIKRQVKLLKEMGCNSIRITHNPGADVMIQVCNELGMLVIEEAFDGWEYAKNGNTKDYSRFYNQTIGSDNAILGGSSDMTWSEFDLTAMISRDYNAPAIIMWSLGNEVWEGTSNASQAYVTQAERLSELAKKLDSSRPSTIGDNKLKEQNTFSFGMAEKLIAVDGVIGANYCNGAQYDTVHNKYPNAPLYGSETASHTNSRGIYNITGSNVQNSTKTLTSYDYSCVGWGETASNAWYTIITRDYVAGEYVWTGFDYLGEPTPYNNTGSGNFSEDAPKSSYFGIIDTAGLPKDTYYFYQSQWNDEVHTLHVLPAWNEDVVSDKSNVPIVVYSDAAAVELFFTNANGVRTSLGKKTFTQKTTDAGFTYQIYEGDGKDSAEHRNLYLTWYKAFEAGTIEAVAYDKDGNVIEDTVGRSKVQTTGSEARLQASADRTEISADGKDLAYITVDVTDSKGNIVPDASNNVTFDVEGDGVLVGIDNGKQSDHQSFQDDNRNAFSGSLVAIVQSTKNAGSFKVTATSNGLQSASVTVTTAAVSDEEVKVDVDYFYMSKTYYVKQGSAVILPETLETYYTDGSVKSLPVVWDRVPEGAAGTFAVNGMVNNSYKVTVTVNMIEDVTALLNYSTTTPVGQAPVLPSSRPAVMADGNILDVSFPVTWASIDADSYAWENTFTVHGVSNVLGKLMEVTASVRVQAETISLVGNVDNPLTLSQDIKEELQSDTLAAIWDGSTTVSDNSSGGANPTAWTNYESSQAGNNKAEIVFEYSTQQRVGEIKIYFFRDNSSVRYPDAGATKIMISENGIDWTEVTASETIGEESNRVKAYTYTFSPFTATFIKFCITNASALSRSTTKPCTGITEIEISKAVGSYSTNNTADLSMLKVNGEELSSSALTKDTYYTTDAVAITEFLSESNAAVTVLPVNESEVKLILESEDHKTTKIFTIHLEENAPIIADDNDNDYVGKITVDKSSQNSESDKADNVLDGNESTIWHSTWDSSQWGNNLTSDGHPWISLNFSEAVEVSALRYLPRSSGGRNGDITEYRIEGKTSNAADAEWVTLGNGIWTSDGANWKLATFDKTTTVYALRLVAVKSVGNSGQENRYASAAEIRVVGSAAAADGTETKIYDGTISGEGSSECTGYEASKAVDQSTDSFWQTDWNAAAPENGPYYTLALEQEITIDQLRYYPRFENGDASSGGQNGFISRYEVYVSTDGTSWSKNPVASNVSGDPLTVADQWYEINFDAAVNAKYVRIYAKEVYVNGSKTNVGNNMSIAELQVRQVIKKETAEVSKDALKLLISEAEKMSPANYTKDSWNTFQEILKLANAVSANENATQDEVNAKKDALDTAMKRLVPLASTEDLDHVIATASDLKEADYTPKSWNTLTKALAMAEAIDENASAQSLQIIAQSITDAINKLVYRADKSDLSKKLDEVKAFNQNDYTSETWSIFEAALAEATIIFNDANATADEVDDALSNLKSAADGLKKAEKPEDNDKNDPAVTPDDSNPENPADDKKPTNSNGSSQNDSTSSSSSSSGKQPASSSTAAAGTGAKTGDPASLMMWTMVMLSMAALVIVMRKRSR